MQKAVFLSVFSAICGLTVGQALRLDISEPLLLIAFFVLCIGWYWLTSRRHRAVRFFSRFRLIAPKRLGEGHENTHQVPKASSEITSCEQTQDKAA